MRRPKKAPKIVILAGPNGAGKTTFAREFLASEESKPKFINADLIARGLSPFAPERAAFEAGRIMLTQIEQFVQRSESFAFETTLSGLTYARQIRKWREAGYYVKLIFLSLPTVELALARIRMRVSQGGHDVPEEIVHRRFTAGLENFRNIYQKLANLWILYDNSGNQPRPIEMGENK